MFVLPCSNIIRSICQGTTILTHPGMVRNPNYLPYVSQTTPLSIIKGTVCYTVWLMHHAILQRGRVLKVSPSPIQGHGSIPDSDSIKSRTRLLLTGTNICHNIVWPIHFLQACRKCTWKPYVIMSVNDSNDVDNCA